MTTKEIEISYTLRQENIDELVNPNRGVTIISPKGEIENLLTKLCAQAPNLGFINSQTYTTTGVVQHFKAFTDFEADDIWTKLGKHISRSLVEGFESLGYSKLFTTPLDLADFTLQYYPQSREGEQFALSPHRDQSGFINLVVVFLVYGPSAFFICKDREGTRPIEPTEIISRPGDLVVMRAGEFKNANAELRRPCHYVGRVESPRGRLSFALRQITDDKSKVKKLECFFGRKYSTEEKIEHQQ